MSTPDPHPDETAPDVGGYLVPIDPMEALSCDSCQ